MEQGHSYMRVWNGAQYVSAPMVRLKNGVPLDEYSKEVVLRQRLSQEYRKPC